MVTDDLARLADVATLGAPASQTVPTVTRSRDACATAVSTRSRRASRAGPIAARSAKLTPRSTSGASGSRCARPTTPRRSRAVSSFAVLRSRTPTRPATNMAAWLWNSREEYALAHAVYAWLLTEALAVGDTEAIEPCTTRNVRPRRATRGPAAVTTALDCCPPTRLLASAHGRDDVLAGRSRGDPSCRHDQQIADPRFHQARVRRRARCRWQVPRSTVPFAARGGPDRQSRGGPTDLDHDHAIRCTHARRTSFHVRADARALVIASSSPRFRPRATRGRETTIRRWRIGNPAPQSSSTLRHYEREQLAGHFGEGVPARVTTQNGYRFIGRRSSRRARRDDDARRRGRCESDHEIFRS